jgi:uncharacterized protein
VRISVAKIPAQGLELEFIEKPGQFPVLAEMAQNGEITFAHPILNRITVQQIAGSIEVRGSVETSVRLPCGRCLEEFEQPLKKAYRLYFTPTSPDDPEFPDGDGIELDSETINRAFYEDDEIDLAESIQEQVVLALPPYPICDESCKGLCPQCGANQNTTGCDCRREEKYNPFAVLKKLNLPEQ